MIVFAKAIIVVDARSPGARAHRASGGSRKQQKRWLDAQTSGGDVEKAIPDPIPNSEVKLLGADGTAWATVWESRKLPGYQ